MRYHHSGNQPVYAPNSYGGPRAEPQRYRDPSWFVEAGEIMRTAYVAHKDDNDFIQPGMLYRNVMTPTDRDHLVSNIVGHLGQGVERFIQERAVNDYFSKVDPELGECVTRAPPQLARQPGEVCDAARLLLVSARKFTVAGFRRARLRGQNRTNCPEERSIEARALASVGQARF